MLLFKPEHVGPILEGRKTETRRMWTKWRGYSYGTAAVERRLRQQGAEL